MKKILSGIFSALFFSMTFLSCGLDTFYIIPQPTYKTMVATEINNDAKNNYVKFETYEHNMPSDFEFDGTLVYYRIFSSASACNKVYTDIEASNNESSYENSINKITASYQVLKCENSSGAIQEFIVPGNGIDKEVEIRLVDNYEIDSPISEYASYIKINGIELYKPLRYLSEKNKKRTYNFGWRNKSDYSEICSLPESGEFDFNGGSVEENDFYYIDLYAMGKGHDTTIKPYYSRPLHLGVIKVNPSAHLNNWNL